MKRARKEEPAPALRLDAPRHQDRLCGCRRAVVEPGIGYLQTGELAHKSLILIDGLKGSLTDLGLVGSVGGRELGAGYDRVHGAGNGMVVDPAAEKKVPTFWRSIFCRKSRHVPFHLH